KHSHLRIHELDDVSMTDRQRIVGRIAQHRGSLRSLEAFAQAVETGDKRWGGALALFGLFDRCGGERCLCGGDCKRRSGFRRDHAMRRLCWTALSPWILAVASLGWPGLAAAQSIKTPAELMPADAATYIELRQPGQLVKELQGLLEGSVLSRPAALAKLQETYK